jgi:hypothetical protein
MTTGGFQMIEKETPAKTPAVTTESSIPIETSAPLSDGSIGLSNVEELFSKFALSIKEGKNKDAIDEIIRQITSLIEGGNAIDIISRLAKYFNSQKETHHNEITQMRAAHQNEMKESKVIMNTAHQNEINQTKTAYQNKMKEYEESTQELISQTEKHYISRTIELERNQLQYPIEIKKLKEENLFVVTENKNLKLEIEHKNNEITVVRQRNAIILEEKDDELIKENMRQKKEIDRLRELIEKNKHNEEQNTVSGNTREVVQWSPLIFRRNF